MHMEMKEEEMLFPMINQGVGRGAAMPISVMMRTRRTRPRHRTAQRADRQFQRERACGSWTRLYAGERNVEDLNDHIHLENDILFARVLDS